MSGAFLFQGHLLPLDLSRGPMLKIQEVPYESYLEALAHMRIQVFAEYPYLYEGNLAYEKDYLERYARCPEAILAALLDEQGIAQGFCTGIPLCHEEDELRNPIPKPWEHCFYIGEILLAPEIRGQGWGKQMMTKILSLSEERGFSKHYLYTVVEPLEHRPSHYQSPAFLWESLHFHKTNLRTQFEWKRWDQNQTAFHLMDLWER